MTSSVGPEQDLAAYREIEGNNERLMLGNSNLWSQESDISELSSQAVGTMRPTENGSRRSSP
ncbi:uncharacterized protein N7515_008598 [Penicillium bovifimosum]|uniref:Uncharacterized protein n=1 Tax=Penicillium bovifimosum TaxID=126998 RepID=A0A9W9GN90_9EURO|nr:uncharacterized protein N7515_008598 [Penicillium bovifimosum]KAJ5124773.1 hypothetical protein N7515_008598 [Penicillium bovifimosum]